MIQISYCIVAAVLGLLLGFLYFTSLLVGLKKFFNSKSSSFLIFGFLLRIFLVGGMVFLMFKFARIIQILLFFIGFLISMAAMIWKNGFKRKRTYEN